MKCWFSYKIRIYGQTNRDKIRVNLKIRAGHLPNLNELLLRLKNIFRGIKVPDLVFLIKATIPKARRSECIPADKGIKGKCPNFPGMNLMKAFEPNGKSKC
jgi:hypothetical protein